MPRYNQQIGFPPFTPIVKNLIIINALVWVAESFISPQVTDMMMNNFALHSAYSVYFKPWQLFTYMFMHSPFGDSLGIMHILLNMLGLWMFGSQLEISFGPKWFLIFYLVCGVGAALVQVGYSQFDLHNINALYHSLRVSPFARSEDLQQVTDIINQSSLGASGAVYGILAAFAYLFPNAYILVYFIPLKAKWAMLAILAYELFAVVHPSAGDNVGHVAHLGGALIGFLFIYLKNKNDRRNFY